MATKKAERLHAARLDALAAEKKADARLELARAELALATARWRNEVGHSDLSHHIAAAESRIAAAKAKVAS